jgi:hypothetical protein
MNDLNFGQVIIIDDNHLSNFKTLEELKLKEYILNSDVNIWRVCLYHIYPSSIEFDGAPLHDNHSFLVITDDCCIFELHDFWEGHHFDSYDEVFDIKSEPWDYPVLSKE